MKHALQRPASAGGAGVALRRDRFLRVFERTREIGDIDGLEQIFAYPDLDRFPRVRELRISAEDDDPGADRLLLEPVQHRETVHVGHADVRDHEVGPRFLYDPDAGQSVLGLAYDLIIRGYLADQLGQAFADPDFVLDDHYPHFVRLPIHVAGISMNIRVPSPFALSTRTRAASP